jgi:hypothetical protein
MPATTQTEHRSIYADPAAAATVRQRITAKIAEFEAMCLPVATLVELAATFGTTYIAGDADAARAYYQGLLGADTDADEVADEAIEALTLTALFGPNGSDEQRAAVHATRWAPGIGD